MPKCMLFDGLEPRLALYSSLISHFRHFQKMSKNQCKKRIQISCFLMQNWDFWTPRSIDSALLVVFGRCRKIVIFYVGLGRPKNYKNSILSRPRDPRVTPGIAQGSPGDRPGVAFQRTASPRQAPFIKEIGKLV